MAQEIKFVYEILRLISETHFSASVQLFSTVEKNSLFGQWIKYKHYHLSVEDSNDFINLFSVCTEGKYTGYV